MAKSVVVYNRKMGTWISHLRIAEELLRGITNLDEVGFTFGSLAPDSGLPNEDWSEFNPPKSVTHYLPEGSGEHGTRDLLFFRKFVGGYPPVSRFDFGFKLDYFIHLVCDHLAAERFGQSSREYYDKLFQEKSASEAWDLIKADWYGLDHLYLREHPQSLFWKVFLPARIPLNPIPFIPQSAFVHQMKYIKEYYSLPDENRVLDRRYPYMNEKTMSRYIQDSVNSCFKILGSLRDKDPDSKFTSAVELLSTKERAPLPPPLGDSS